ncbi:MAG: hypothetical protein IJA85_07155 [Clostridia bacterium]|nr:hypothetical protein [Clostridia bacterium]MBQ4574965.1 hypothetical protein [Clostridia bacterium]
MKNETTTEIKISGDLLAKLQYVADAEGRSLNNQFLMMARNAVAYYEKVHGKIKDADLKKE